MKISTQRAIGKTILNASTWGKEYAAEQMQWYKANNAGRFGEGGKIEITEKELAHIIGHAYGKCAVDLNFHGLLKPAV